MPTVKRLVVVTVVLLLFAPMFDFSAINRTKADNLIKIPVVELFDLLVDGSNTPQHFTPNQTFSFIERGIWMLHFTDNAIDYDLWGSGPALTNGTAMFYDNISLLPENISTNHDLSHDCFDYAINQDAKNPKDNHISARYSFNKFVAPGLFMGGDHDLTIIVQDNVTLAANDVDLFTFTIQGYVWAEDQVLEGKREDDAFRQAFSSKAFVFPSPLYAFGVILLFLALFYMIYRKFIR